MAARAHIRQLRAARHQIGVAVFRTSPGIADGSLSQPTSIPNPVSTVSDCRDNKLSGGGSWNIAKTNIGSARGYATKPRGLFGFLGKGGDIFHSREQKSPQSDSDYYNGGEVDTKDRDHEFEERPRLKDKDTQLVHVKDTDTNAKGAEVSTNALDKGATVATSALDNVGNILSKTGLEVELDVSLGELTIKELVLKDLGLHLTIKTKPQPQAGSQSPAPVE